MKLLIFIPARQGSKGIRDKNFKKLNGKPLIDYTLKFAKKIRKKEKSSTIFFSTDSKKYLNYSSKKGNKFNYLRPKRLSGNNSNIMDAIFHGVEWLKEKKLHFDTILLLQPTSPFRRIKEAMKVINNFKKMNKKSLVSVTKMSEHPFKCLKVKKNKWNFLEKNKKNLFRRQQYKKSEIEYYFIDGTYYISKLKFLNKNKTFVKEGKTNIYLLKGKRPPDIDEFSDFQITELFYKNYVSY